ncbi:MAG: peptidoglycan-binding domain-containing protein [Candidatus Omnitrophota bacterium]
MNVKYLNWWVFICFLALLYGCAGSKAYQKQEMGRLQSRVTQLESEIEARDIRQKETERLLELEARARKALEEKLYTSKIEASPKKETAKYAVKDIQMALSNSGFNAGPIDGKFGKKTKQAVIGFQRAHGLVADGVVGEKTWSKLSEYLSGKVK